MKTVVALYDDIVDARTAVESLVDAGVARDDISMIARDVNEEYSHEFDGERERGDTAGEAAATGAVGGAMIGGLAGVLVGLGAFAIPGVGPVVAAGPLAAGLTGAGVGAITGGLLGALVGWGIPEEEAEYYAEGVRRGGVLVAVRVSDERTEEIVDILDDHDPVDVQRRAAYWQAEEGWTGYDPEAEPYDAERISASREQWAVWDTDYEYDEDLDYDYDEDDEFIGSSSPSMLGRGARVHAETGTAGMDSQTTAGIADATFDDYDADFRRHYDRHFATSGYRYDRYQPAYRYGYSLATDRRYQDVGWNQLESPARQRWEETNDGTWEEFKDAVRHAWERAKEAVT